MITTYTNGTYRITYNGVSMVENALGNPNLIQIAVVYGCVIALKKNDQYGITYLPNGEPRTWTLSGLNTKLNKVDRHFIYARLSKSDDTGLIVFSTNDYEIDGKITGDSTSIASDTYYYIKIGGISATDTLESAKLEREINYDGGYFESTEYNEEDAGGWSKLFTLTSDGLINALKYLASFTIKGTLSIIGKLVLNEKQLSDIGRNSDEEVHINDETIPTTSYLHNKYFNVINDNIINKTDELYISKKKDSSAAGLITFLKGLISEGLIQANDGLVVRKKELVEAALMSLIEEGEDSLIEEIRTSTGNVATLGELENVSDDADLTSTTNDLLIHLAGSSEWSINTTLFSNVSQLMVKVFPFTMTLSGGGTYEKGSSQTINLSWTYDRDIESQSINNESLLIGIRSKQYANVTSDTTYILKAIQGGQTYTKSVSAQFKVKKYYGVSANGTLTNAEILVLQSAWAQRTQSSTVFDCTGGKYPYYILPASMVNDIQFWIGGLRNTDWREEVINVTNAYGHTESYTIFRLNSIQTGVLNIEVK